MTATHVAERGLGEIRLSLVTPERQPLELFGAQASQTVRELLDERGIDLHASRYPVRFEDGQLSLIPNGTLAAERVVSLPSLLGPQLEGLSADPNGFIPVDLPRARARGRGCLRRRRCHQFADQARRRSQPTGRRCRRGDCGARRRSRGPAPFRPVLRGVLLGLHTALHECRGERRPRRRLARLGPRTLVAAEQDRRQAARALPGASSRRAGDRADGSYGARRGAG